MAQSPEHRLLSLPDDKIAEKIRKMNLRERLEFSLISERCKDLVTSIQIKATSFHVSVGSRITIHIRANSTKMDIIFYMEPDMYWGIGAYGRKKKLTEPQSVLVKISYWISRYENVTSKLEHRDTTMKDWLKHLQDIFGYQKIDEIQFSQNSSWFDVDDIKEVFGNTTTVDIKNTGCFAFNQLILQKFSHIEKVSIFTSDFPNSEIPESILVQNFANLRISDEVEESTLRALDELLLMNSKVIFVESHHITPKQLKNFIKLWQKGSNPHLEHLFIDYFQAKEEDVEIVMKKIKHDVIPNNRTRNFKSVGLPRTSTVHGGLDIYRVDGTKATIEIGNANSYFYLYMYVWFDHCVVDS